MTGSWDQPTDDLATDLQSLAMLAYVAIHRDRDAAVATAHILSRSPHWIGGRELAVLAVSDGFVLYDLSAEASNSDLRVVAVVTPNDGSMASARRNLASNRENLDRKGSP